MECSLTIYCLGRSLDNHPGFLHTLLEQQVTSPDWMINIRTPLSKLRRSLPDSYDETYVGRYEDRSITNWPRSIHALPYFHFFLTTDDRKHCCGRGGVYPKHWDNFQRVEILSSRQDLMMIERPPVVGEELQLQFGNRLTSHELQFVRCWNGFTHIVMKRKDPEKHHLTHCTHACLHQSIPLGSSWWREEGSKLFLKLTTSFPRPR